MPDNKNRKRPIQVKFFVDEKSLLPSSSEWWSPARVILVPIFAPWLWRGLSQLPIARKSLNRENHKSRDCLITIFTRNSSAGAQPLSPKLLKGLGWSRLSARSSASKCIAFWGRHWRPASQQVFARVGTAVHCLLTPSMGLASKLDFAKIAECSYTCCACYSSFP